jgi:hypothetical protein
MTVWSLFYIFTVPTRSHEKNFCQDLSIPARATRPSQLEVVPCLASRGAASSCQLLQGSTRRAAFLLTRGSARSISPRSRSRMTLKDNTLTGPGSRATSICQAMDNRNGDIQLRAAPRGSRAPRGRDPSRGEHRHAGPGEWAPQDVARNDGPRLVCQCATRKTLFCTWGTARPIQSDRACARHGHLGAAAALGAAGVLACLWLQGPTLGDGCLLPRPSVARETGRATWT